MRKPFIVIFLLGCVYSGLALGFTLTSPAFKNGDMIPGQFTCDGIDKNYPPDLQWFDIPVGTQSLALIVNDPDAPSGSWIHWVVFNIPATVTHLTSTAVPAGMLQGSNSWRRAGYDGPCPPSGMHHYVFTLYALDAMLTLLAGADAAQVQSAAAQHILGQAILVGQYQKSKK